MILRKISLVMVTLSLCACSLIVTKHGTIHDRTKDYLDATTIPPMKVPAGTKTAGITEHYPVANPPAAGSLSAPVSVLPPELS